VSQPSGGWQSSRVGERSHISAGCLTTAACDRRLRRAAADGL